MEESKLGERLNKWLRDLQSRTLSQVDDELLDHAVEVGVCFAPATQLGKLLQKECV